MSQRLRSYVRQNHLALIALMVAVVGVPTAWALARNTVGSPQIKKNAVKNSDLADNSAGSPEVIDNSLTGADLSEGTLGPVPSAVTAANATSAGNANLLDGLDSTAFKSSSAPVGGVMTGRVTGLANGTFYAAPSGESAANATRTNVQMLMPQGGTIVAGDLRVGVPDLGPGQSVQVLLVNGSVDTALGCTITGTVGIELACVDTDEETLSGSTTWSMKVISTNVTFDVLFGLRVAS